MARPMLPAEVGPEARDLGDEPARRHGHAPRREADALRVREQAERARRRLVVVERLAHAHEDDVAQSLVRVETRHARRAPGPTISSGPRWRFSPATPLAQKTQPIAHPTCVEMHWVTRTGSCPSAGPPLASPAPPSCSSSSSSTAAAASASTSRARAGDGRSPLPPVTPGMSTVSTVAPSPRRTRSLRVSSAARRSSAISIARSHRRATRAPRGAPAGRSVIAFGVEHAAGVHPAEDLAPVKRPPAEGGSPPPTPLGFAREAERRSRYPMVPRTPSYPPSPSFASSQ